jgi:polyhydroxyalkanoate synthase
MFIVGTETDHVAPWRSVYKVGKLVRSADYTFCLTSGGHNAGIISGPQHPKRRHRVLHTKSGARLLSPEKYMEKVEPLPGSWWPTWAKWLEERSAQRKVPPPAMGAPKKGLKPVCDAPGTYVRQK